MATNLTTTFATMDPTYSSAGTPDALMTRGEAAALIDVSLSAPVIVTPTVPSTAVGSSSSGRVIVQGSPVPAMWVEGNPPGFTVSPIGDWVWTPQTAGTFTGVTIRAQSILGEATPVVITIVSTDSTSAPAWSTPAAGTLTAIVKDAPVNIPLVLTGSPKSFITVSAGTLNPGLGIDNNSTPPAIIGSATTSGAGTSFTLSASNGIGSAATRAFTQPVNEPATITDTSIPNATAGTSGSHQLTIGGFPTGGTTSLVSGPTGASINGTGLISWTTARVVGVDTLVISVTNGVTPVKSYTFNQTVVASAAWTPAAGYAGYMVADRDVTLGTSPGVATWADSGSGNSFSNSTYAEPVQDLGAGFIRFEDSPTSSLISTAFDFNAPVFIGLRMRMNSSTAANSSRQIMKSIDHFMYGWRSSTPGQDKFGMNFAGTTVFCPVGSYADTFVSVGFWMTNSTTAGCRCGAAETENAALSGIARFRDVQMNGNNTPLDMDVVAWCWYTDTTKYDSTAKRDAIIASLDNAAIGGSAPPPIPPSGTILQEDDTRMESWLDPRKAFASYPLGYFITSGDPSTAGAASPPFNTIQEPGKLARVLGVEQPGQYWCRRFTDIDGAWYELKISDAWDNWRYDIGGLTSRAEIGGGPGRSDVIQYEVEYWIGTSYKFAADCFGHNGNNVALFDIHEQDFSPVTSPPANLAGGVMNAIFLGNNSNVDKLYWRNRTDTGFPPYGAGAGNTDVALIDGTGVPPTDTHIYVIRNVKISRAATGIRKCWVAIGSGPLVQRVNQTNVVTGIELANHRYFTKVELYKWDQTWGSKTTRTIQTKGSYIFRAGAPAAGRPVLDETSMFALLKSI